jgi:hypothetical protein
LLTASGPLPTVCNGTLSLGGDGLSINSAAASCASAYNYFSVTNTSVWVDVSAQGRTPNPAIATRVWCVAGNMIAGNGSSQNKPASSCEQAYRVFNVSDANIYVDYTGAVPALPQNARFVHCQNGVNLGGDGTTLNSSSTSCYELIMHWGHPQGTYYINGSLTTYVPSTLHGYTDLALLCDSCIRWSVNGIKPRSIVLVLG